MIAPPPAAVEQAHLYDDPKEHTLTEAKKLQEV
jgi:hypothetical protein